MTYTIRTNHIQKLIANAQHLAKAVHLELAGTTIALPPEVYASSDVVGRAHVEHILCKAISDLRHAADELDSERLSCFGWRQV